MTPERMRPVMIWHMEIHTFRDDALGASSGYEKRTSVSLRLTPNEADDLLVSLQDLLAQAGKWNEGWHVHTYAWDESCEIVLMPDREGTVSETKRPLA
jgi:hypothetical protein